MPGLGRKPSPPDSRDWTVDRLESLITAGTHVPMLWNDPVLLDQGETPKCIGFGGAGFEATAGASIGVDLNITDADGIRIYAEAKEIDGDNEDGSTVRSLAKALQKSEGVIDAYAFGTFAQAKAWVQTHGPVIIGTDWYNGMFRPSLHGVVHLTGGIAGGHCTLWHATDQKVSAAYYNRLRCAWGVWGIDGDCFISDTNLKKLLANQGEALMAVRLK
jgi:hypothetical protein